LCAEWIAGRIIIIIKNQEAGVSGKKQQCLDVGSSDGGGEKGLGLRFLKTVWIGPADGL
jgi:hypothetical protein